jgi:hypothetical protein
VLRIAGFGDKDDYKNKIMFLNFRFFRWGPERRVKRVRTLDRAPPLAPAEIFRLVITVKIRITSGLIKEFQNHPEPHMSFAKFCIRRSYSYSMGCVMDWVGLNVGWMV